jgi:hypothetical protein
MRLWMPGITPLVSAFRWFKAMNMEDIHVGQYLIAVRGREPDSRGQRRNPGSPNLDGRAG